MATLMQLLGLEKRAKLPDLKVSGGMFQSSIIPNWFNFGENSSGKTVNQTTSLNLSAFYGSVRNISEDISKLPFFVYQVDENGNKTKVANVASYLINKYPSDVSTPFTFRQTLIEYALIDGNGYAYIDRDANAKPIALYVLDSRYVTPQIYNGKLYYIIQDVNTGVRGTFTQDDIFHIKGMGDGYIGKSVVGYAAESIGKSLATQSYASGFFGNGATMTGTIEVPGNVPDENAAKSIKEKFISSIKGTGTAAGVGLLANGAKFTKISVTPNEAQFIESQEFNVADIARWFRMPLSKLQAGSTSSSNLEQLNIEYVTDCLMPWIIRFEQEIERKLFKTNEMETLDAKFSANMLMRGDSAAMSQFVTRMYMIGAYNANDALRFMGENTIGEAGNHYMIPVNMIPSTEASAFWAGKSLNDSKATDKQPIGDN
jgi:HK97 family phage portal protein